MPGTPNGAANSNVWSNVNMRTNMQQLINASWTY